MTKPRKVTVERVRLEEQGAEVAAILDFFAKHPERYTGVMVIAELPDGAYQVKYSGTANVAERIGRLELLKEQVLDDAEEDVEQGEEWYQYLRQKGH